MPQIGNINTLDSDRSTPVVYTAFSPSSGDRTPAIWRAEAESVFAGHRSTVSVMTRYNGPKTGRIFEAEFRFPYAVPDTQQAGREVLIAQMPFRVTGTIPLNVPDAWLSKRVNWMTTFVDSQLFRDMLVAGSAAS
ncbi:MAG: hypothetical protein [Sanya fiers-like virus 3]|nr:MAG: hypothetical protein [Sanya fiers-like virus 3]UUW21173.1 MAG: hypothetical protein [Sanya fiers-like virus 3]UYL94452.1 MAG: hypothetical protein [Sanya fiers-like virus 3]